MADARQFAKLDLGYFDNPKVADFVDEHPRVPMLHLRAILYCRQHLTNGKFPVRLVARLIGATWCGSQCESQCDVCRAADADLIARIDGRNYMVHDYLEHQESAEDVQKRSDAGRKGAAVRWGGRKDADRNAKGNADRNAGTSAKGNAEKRREEKNTLARFDEFWEAYDKKVGRKAAEAKWSSAIKKGADPDVLIKAAGRYVDGIRAKGDHPRYTKNPATWLNGEHWEDEPMSTVTQLPQREKPSLALLPKCPTCNAPQEVTHYDECPDQKWRPTA